MVDVQLERGFLRVANALDEAITYAEFTATQAKIVRCLIRLTYGWQQQTVRIARPAIAERCHVAMHGGGFKQAFNELLEQGVIVEVQPASGRLPSTYAINKNFEQWGKFSVAAGVLAALFSERPDSGRLAVEGPSTRALEGPQKAQESKAQESTAHSTGLPRPLRGHVSPYSVRHSSVGKKGKTVSNTTAACYAPENEASSAVDGNGHSSAVPSAPTGPSVPSESLAATIVLVSAANRGIAERWGEQPSPLRHDAGTTHEAAELLASKGVPTAFARDVIYAWCKTARATRPPRSMNYFVPLVLDQWAADAERQRAAAIQPEPRDLRRPSIRPASSAVSVREELEAWARETEEREAKAGTHG